MSTKIFIPFSEALMDTHTAPPGELVPYQMAYECVRLLDGSYDFRPVGEGGTTVKVELTEPRDLISRGQMGHAA